MNVFWFNTLGQKISKYCLEHTIIFYAGLIDIVQIVDWCLIPPLPVPHSRENQTKSSMYLQMDMTFSMLI